MILTLDTGTTNTRIRLFDGETLVDTEKCRVGVGSTTKTGSNQLLKDAIAGGVRAILERNGLQESDVPQILASGMLGSELGLYALPHVFAPATPEDLLAGSCVIEMPEVTAIPIRILPGVKNRVEYSAENLSEMDVMRGEETEFFGICEICGLNGPMLAVLPGSHTKLIVSDGKQILSCHTTMTGELIAAVSGNTILKNALPEALYDAIDPDFLERGCQYCEEHGINESLFRVRISKMFLELTDVQRASFFFGIILEGDIRLILRRAEDRAIVIGGPEPLRSALESLLKPRCSNPIRKLTDEEVEMSVSAGALRLWKKQRL